MNNLFILRLNIVRRAKVALKTKIMASKTPCFKCLYHSANANPWSDAYRIVMTKTRCLIALTKQSAEMMEGIIEGLFLRHDPSAWPNFVGLQGTGADDEKRVTD